MSIKGERRVRGLILEHTVVCLLHIYRHFCYRDL